MKNSAIEWTTHTFNPWIGCTRISPACDHCYAADWDKRYHDGEHWGAGAPRRRTSADNWRQPRKWARQARETGERPRVFCCSLADVFDNEVPPEWREDLWQVIRDTPELDWLLLTKRIGNVRQMLPEDWGDGWPHVWLGITVVTQEEAGRDIPKRSGFQRPSDGYRWNRFSGASGSTPTRSPSDRVSSAGARMSLASRVGR